jgi:ribulose-5-phosphate 4-epimerase/fuculose-1-phosphate aldolase
VDWVDEFRAAGRSLFSLGMVKGAEGNLSVFDGAVITITRTGVSLADIDQSALASGGLAGEISGASSDLEVHRTAYRERGSGAVVHAHPEGTVPEDGGGPGAHGTYTFGPSLAEAVTEAVMLARTSGPKAETE